MIARHVLQQGPMIGTLGRIALEALRQRVLPAPEPRGGATPPTPGPDLPETVAPRDPGLVRDYVRWCGGDVDAWKGTLPPHLFAQWGFPLLSRTLAGIRYPMARVLNGGCRLDLYAIVPLGERDAAKTAKGTRPVVPADGREIGKLELAGNAGFEFACLTGDFNPVHWIAPYGWAAGFGGCILHGFATLALAVERLNRAVLGSDVRALKVVDVRFTRPLRLPARVAVFHRPGELYVGAAPGEPANLTGTYET